MAAKKGFKIDPVMQFISTEEERPAEDQVQTSEGYDTRRYKLTPVAKTARLQLLVRPYTKEAIKKAADEQGLSMNELINQILDEYAEKRGNL